MVLDAITSPSFGLFTELLSQTIESIVEVVVASRDVAVEKKSFAELSSYLDRVVPFLEELKLKNTTDSRGLARIIENLNEQTKAAKELIVECSKRNKVYLLMSCRSIARRIEDITREICRTLTCIPLASLDISSGIKEDILTLLENLRTAEFKAAISEEEILRRIERGLEGRSIDRSHANNLLISIAEAVGISTEKSELKKEFEEFKSEIEAARLRKDMAEALQMDQIISLLERADATSSREEKERKYFSKRKSLGSLPLEPLQSFICPITGEVMEDPVETPSGHTYERSAIVKWLADKKWCPITSYPLDNSMLRPNKTLRQSIEEWKDRNTVITLSSMKSKLFSEDAEEVLHCLGQLKDLCEQREIHREWTVLENYMPTLIELLAVKNRDVRKGALSILCLLAEDDDETKERIAKFDNALESVVHSLVRRIDEGKLAVSLLLELSKSEIAREIIGKVQGCILSLVAMSSSDDNQAAKDAREVLENLSFSDENVILMAKCNYFMYLLQRLSSGPDNVKMMMAKAVVEMELTDHSKSTLFQDGILASLIHLISHGDVEMKSVASRALLNLSSLPSNCVEMVRQGAVRTLLDILYRHTSSQTLREHVAAIVMHIAMSTFVQGSNEAEHFILECDDDLHELFSLINLTGPAVQQCILRAFRAMCQSSSAATVKARLIQCSAIQVLIQLFETDDSNVRGNAVKLLCCLTEDGDEAVIIEHIDENSIQTLLKIIRNSSDEEEIASAMGIIGNLPESPNISEWLQETEGLPLIFSYCSDRKHYDHNKNYLIENAVGAIRRFTVPKNQNLQKKAAEAGVIPVLVNLLDSGTSLMKRQAALSLAQFSENSLLLTGPIRRFRVLFCCSASQEARCPVHRGICAVESSFCLLEAGAMVPLAKILGESDPGAAEASLDAIWTLIKDERLENGGKVLEEANAIPSIIQLLSSTSLGLQEKAVISLERIFRFVDVKHKHGASAQMQLVFLTQQGSGRMKSLAARVLAQLNILHDQSSYF